MYTALPNTSNLTPCPACLFANYTQYIQVGLKHDQDKPDLSLIPKEPLWELARVLMAGEKKYGRDNWRNGIDINRLTAAAMRHITQFNEGENVDDETKTNHLMNATANLFFAFWMLNNKPKHDNRGNK
jgi:hypothetical protein